MRQTRCKNKPPPKNITKSKEYYAKNPSPAYANFGEPDFIDTKGREYRVATGPFSEAYQEQEGAFVPGFDTPALDITYTQNWGVQMLWFRVPIALRGTTPVPSVDEFAGERIHLYHVQRQVLCTARVEAVYVYHYKKTGHVLLSGTRSSGQVSDPGNYEPLLRRNLKTHIQKRY